ncbi:UDP-N-acetylmuramoyl-tripeptide--D-alanyl-D-alanine ligase [Enterovibrio nigricans]|uniref:UDP-N-acetylmuramoyl-tripeptide--D-alanyl-D-alanine ligase n=1 Tax=Enterovibrio nigricans DSM 22720 TaxID=1121868 RepID=A0A1T4TWY7_9GAMM|nr:UDP-N-acetylmuramoyl-tripeptide--D-alanyl-D-alanine ligase [Enterovibrio nigricans]PKF51434.1 UDP-N-acetylmuramoyl-tripeptide--D-alanyl-D-alanine ligase [Enterovibrio nigricans]SKA44992.1 UDP-N-acetylmuramoyl-tripeptide--D-alanyl-D-alanine ligase [Enterovibrio nigricans DSM 22720]
MIPVSLSTLRDVLKADLVGQDVAIDAVSTDTRTLGDGALFVSLIGERFDAHDFVETAKNNGASALLVSKPIEIDLPQLVVENTTLALGQLGAWVKSQCNVMTIALTGSCGKTTVKEMLAAILSRKGQTLYTAGNFNNDIGVPLTLLRLQPSDDFAVMELGANHAGEIAYTTQLVKPDIALVTNLAAAHLEGFGSLAGVAKAKGEIYEGLASGAVAIVNLDSNGGDAWTSVLADKRVQTMTVSDVSADYHAKNIQPLESGCYTFELVTPLGEFPVSLSLPGEHNVANAVLAAMTAMNIDGITIDDVIEGLASVLPVKGRGAISFPRPNLRLIDDSYNASLAAMKAAVDLLDGFDGEKVIVLADMGEMGEHSASVHQDLADHLSKASIQTIITHGSASVVISAQCGGQHFEKKDALIAHVVELMKTKSEVSVLVKGANGMKMWEVVSAIEEAEKC